MKKTLLSILGLAAATLATVTLLGQAEASSSSGGGAKNCVRIKQECNDGCKLKPGSLQCYASCMINNGCNNWDSGQ